MHSTAMEEESDDDSVITCIDLQDTFRSLIFEQLPLKTFTSDTFDSDDEAARYKKKFLKENGFRYIFKDNYEDTEHYLTSVWRKNMAPSLVQPVIDSLIQEYQINTPSQELKSDLENYFIELFLQKFYNPSRQRLMNTCNCTKALLDDKLHFIFKAMSDLSGTHSPDQCSESNPLVCTFFGPGRLLSEYMFFHMLRKKRYNFFVFNGIDKIYTASPQNRAMFQVFSEQLQRHGANTAINVFLSTHTFNSFIYHTRLAQHIIAAIDPGDKKEINKRKALPKSSLARISLMNYLYNREHCITIKFDNLSKIEKTSKEKEICKKETLQDATFTMNAQIHNIHKKLAQRYIGKHHPNRRDLVIDLQDYIEKKQQKLLKRSNNEKYNHIEVSWFKKPSADFLDFVKPFMHPKTHIYMVHNGLKEINLPTH